jgi:hypothetical protein
MDPMRNASLADALIHLREADEVFVRLALSREDKGGWMFRSLVIDVLPKVWLENHDETLLAPWLHDQRPRPFESTTAFFFCGLLKSRAVYAWFERPDDCRLTGFDEWQGYARRQISFSLPDVHDNVAEWRLESYSRTGAKPIPYPSTLYVLTPKQPRTGQFRDDDRLVGENGETFPSFRAARAELLYGMTDRRDMAYSREDTFALRVVDARGWLKEVRVTHDRLLLTVGGTDILRGAYIAAQGPGVNERAPLGSHHASLPLPLPPRITGQIEVVLLGGGSVWDEVVVYSIDHPYPGFPTPAITRYPQVIVEREDVVGYERPANATASANTPTGGSANSASSASQESSTDRPKVFISYSHDTAAHRKRVLNLANRLRREGIETHIDRCVQNPSEGWPRWMKNQIEWADFVVVVCTEIYCRRFNDHEEPGKGLGAAWEGQIITQTIFEQAGNNGKFIPVVFSADDVEHIPQALRPTTRYNLADEMGYDELYARLTDQALTDVPELGEIRKLSPKQD